MKTRNQLPPFRTTPRLTHKPARNICLQARPFSTGDFSVQPIKSATPHIPPDIITPPVIETSIGTLNFTDGFPTRDTVDKIYNQLDFQRAVEACLNALPAVSMFALRKGLRDAGIKNNEVLIFSDLMDSRSLFLTANCDTVCFMTFLDLCKGPMVVEAPAGILAFANDMWFRWIIDLGQPGPDRGMGGKYLFLPPGCDVPSPEGGYFICRSRTKSISLLGHAFLCDNDSGPAASRIRNGLKIYPYIPGGYGTSIASFLSGKSPLSHPCKPVTPKFFEGTGRIMNTLPPNDFSFYEMLNELVQEEPARALDPEIAGQFAAIGIIKGKRFNPDARMRRILNNAVAVANAAARVISFRPRASEGFRYYDDPNSSWSNQLFVGGHEFRTPPPEIIREGIKPFPDTGDRKLNARSATSYAATGITPAMCMRLPNIGSQHLSTFYDSQGNALDGTMTYKLTLPKNIPAAKFWSLTLYDNQTRSMLQTDQRHPRAGSQSYPTPAATPNADGSTTIYFSPRRPGSAKSGNWIQTIPGKGWWTILRLYGPLQPFFDKSWRPGEIEEVK